MSGYPFQPDDRPPDDKCLQCNGSGTVANSVYFPCDYAGPGPVPEYATRVYEAKCDECDGHGRVCHGHLYRREF